MKMFFRTHPRDGEGVGSGGGGMCGAEYAIQLLTQLLLGDIEAWLGVNGTLECGFALSQSD